MKTISEDFTAGEAVETGVFIDPHSLIDKIKKDKQRIILKLQCQLISLKLLHVTNHLTRLIQFEPHAQTKLHSEAYSPIWQFTVTLSPTLNDELCGFTATNFTARTSASISLCIQGLSKLRMKSQ